VAVASNGTDWLVVWSDRRNPTVERWEQTKIYGARVSAAGTVLEPDGFLIHDAHHDHSWVAWDGTNYLVTVNFTVNTDHDIFGIRVSTAGAVIDTTPFPIFVGPGHQEKPVVVSNGSVSLVAWEDYSGATGKIFGARVTP